MHKKNIIQSLFIIILAQCLFCSSKSTPSNIEMTIASYNLHYFMAGYKGIRDTISAVNADVIALQEVLYSNKHDFSRQLARDLGYYHAASAPYQYMSQKSSWLLSFLSKYPIVIKSEKKLGHYRKAFRVSVSVKGRKVTLTTTHLSPFTWSNKHLLAANLQRSRMRQKELSDLLTWIGKSKGYSIVLGDFNSIPLMGELSVMDNYGYKDVYDDLGDKNHGTFPLNPHIYATANKYLPIPKVITFDYIFISGDCKTVKAFVHESKASDHYPVIAKISLLTKEKSKYK